MIARLIARLKAMWLGPQLAAELQHWVFFHDQINARDVDSARELLERIPGEGKPRKWLRTFLLNCSCWLAASLVAVGMKVAYGWEFQIATLFAFGYCMTVQWLIGKGDAS